MIKLASISPNVFPMHCRGPAPNGTKAYLFLPAEFPGSAQDPEPRLLGFGLEFLQFLAGQADRIGLQILFERENFIPDEFPDFEPKVFQFFGELKIKRSQFFFLLCGIRVWYSLGLEESG